MGRRRSSDRSGAAALERSRELVRIGEDAGDSHMLLWGLNIQATAERCLGRFEAAATITRSALELGRSIPDYAALAIAGGNLGLCHLRRGDPGAAVTVLEDTNRLIDARPGHVGMARGQAGPRSTVVGAERHGRNGATQVDLAAARAALTADRGVPLDPGVKSA